MSGGPWSFTLARPRRRMAGVLGGGRGQRTQVLPRLACGRGRELDHNASTGLRAVLWRVDSDVWHSTYRGLSMGVVRRGVEACASLRRRFVPKIRAQTLQRYPASQPVLPSDTLRDMARTLHPVERRTPVVTGPTGVVQAWCTTRAEEPRGRGGVSRLQHVVRPCSCLTAPGSPVCPRPLCR